MAVFSIFHSLWARLRVLKPIFSRMVALVMKISLTMARLRVLKLVVINALTLPSADFTHYGPFEGTETSEIAKAIGRSKISLTMARLRVLKHRRGCPPLRGILISLTMARLRVLKPRSCLSGGKLSTMISLTMARLRVLKLRNAYTNSDKHLISLTMARLRVLKQAKVVIQENAFAISLTMARLRVLKLSFRCDPI